MNFRLYCRRGLAVAALLCAAPAPAPAAPFSWTGAGVSASWADPLNWSTGAVPPDDGTADVSIDSLGSGGTIFLDGARVIRSLTINAGADVFLHPGSVAGSTLALASGILYRATTGLVSAAVPLRGNASSLTGPLLSTTRAVFSLDASPLTASGTTISFGVLRLGAGRLPAFGQLTVGLGGSFDLAGAVDLVGGLVGVGAVTNTAAGTTALLFGGNDMDASFGGALGAVLPGAANGPSFAAIKVGRGAQTFTGASAHTGGTQVQEGALWLGSGGSLPAGGTVAVQGSSTQTALFGGVGTAGAISTRYSAVPGAARIQPGMAASIGILRAASADLSHGAIGFRVANATSGTAGVDYDVLDLGAGAFVSDADTDFTIDLAGLTTSGGSVAVVQTTSQPALSPQSPIHVVNNPNGFAVSLVSDPARGLVVSVQAPQAPAPGFVVTPAHGLVTTQGGGAASFTVKLATQPIANVLVALSSSDASAGQVTPASLTFTPANFAVEQTATATGVVRAVPGGNLAYSIQFAPAVSADPAYASKVAPPVSAISLDARLLTVSAAPGLVTVAGEKTATFTVALAQAPKGPVTVALRSSDPTRGQPVPALLQFGPSATRLSVTVEGVPTAAPGCAPYAVVFYPSFSAGDPAFNGLELAPVPLCNQTGNASLSGPAALSLALAPSPAAPGSRVSLVAHIVNTLATDLVGARLDLSPGGLSLESAAAAGAPLTWDGAGFLLPAIPAGTALDATVSARVTAAPGNPAGATVRVARTTSDALSAPAQAWLTAAPLRLDVGGCSCQSGTPGAALAWMGLAALAFLSRRRRSAPPPRTDQLDGRRGVVARQLGLPGPARAERVDAHHRDALLSLAHHHVGVELARGSDLDRAALHVHAASRLDAPRQGQAGAVGLSGGPAHGEEHLAQRRGRLDRGALRQAADLACADLDLAPLALEGGGAAHGADDDRALTVGGEEEVAAAARGEHVAVLDLEGDRPLAGLDHRFDAAPDAGSQRAGIGPEHAQLAPVEDVDAHAVDGDLGLCIGAGADGVGAEDAVAFARCGPAAAAALELDAPGPVEQDRAPCRGRRAAALRRDLRRDGRRRGLAGADKRDPSEAAQRRNHSSHRSPYRAESRRASTAVRVRA